MYMYYKVTVIRTVFCPLWVVLQRSSGGCIHTSNHNFWLTTSGQASKQEKLLPWQWTVSHHLRADTHKTSQGEGQKGEVDFTRERNRQNYISWGMRCKCVLIHKLGTNYVYVGRSYFWEVSDLHWHIDLLVSSVILSFNIEIRSHGNEALDLTEVTRHFKLTPTEK